MDNQFQAMQGNGQNGYIGQPAPSFSRPATPAMDYTLLHGLPEWAGPVSSASPVAPAARSAGPTGVGRLMGTPVSPVMPAQSAPAMPPPVPQPPGRRRKSNRSGSSGSSSGHGRAVLVLIVGLIALSGIVAFTLWNALGQSAPDVTLYQVSSGTTDNVIGGGGIVYPHQQLDISYPVTERVLAVLVKAGDHVSPNQSLIQLDPSQLNAQLNQSSNDMAAAQAYLNTVSQGHNQITIAQAQQAYNIAKNKFEALLAQASSPTLHQGMLISPMRGVITAINVNPGEVFSANMPLLTIADESSIIVRVKIPLTNVRQVQVGQGAIVTPSALPNLSFHGKVISIVPKADPQTDTFEVWVEVQNPDTILLPGMSAFVRIQSNKQALIVPRLAVLNADREALVFVLHGEVVSLQHVHVIGRTPRAIFVDAGVANGDRVVLVGLDRLENGQRVHVVRVEGK